MNYSITVYHLIMMKRTFIAYCMTILCCLHISACKDADDSGIRVDSEPIQKRLPFLPPINQVRWRYEELTKDSFLSPPPIEHVYKLYGFIELLEGEIERLIGTFDDFEECGAPSGAQEFGLDVDKIVFERSSSFNKLVQDKLGSGDSVELYITKNRSKIYFILKTR